MRSEAERAQLDYPSVHARRAFRTPPHRHYPVSVCALRARTVFPVRARDANVRTPVGATTAWCSERTKALISIEFASIYGSCANEPPIDPSEQPGAQQQRSRPAVPQSQLLLPELEQKRGSDCAAD